MRQTAESCSQKRKMLIGKQGLKRPPERPENRDCRRLKPTSTDKNKRSERGPKGPHHPNVAFVSGLLCRALSETTSEKRTAALVTYLRSSAHRRLPAAPR